MNHPPGESPAAPAERSPYTALATIAAPASPGRWRVWVVPLAPLGRFTLPPEARGVAGGRPAVRAESRGRALVLRAEGVGRLTRLDRRGRLYVPAWLHRLSGSGPVLVAASQPEPSTVVVAPASVLDGVVDALAGEVA